ncbi:hypothetical protein N7530_008911 [Penicillium desertorum]|uniref:glucan 1,4-alpha-glucosidase n=1 Tax=Penicillium desertorum TaxID=1303715 RepID=A0A9W9WQ69_9EURO|nr:hypothetical protein N7530_008911 [Penicillium desertorum]
MNKFLCHNSTAGAFFKTGTLTFFKLVIAMLFKTLIALNALAGAVAPSPASQLHKGQADLEKSIQKEMPIAHQGILNNIGANRKLAQGASPGIVVASPSKDPSYFYTYARDAVLTLMDLIHGFLGGDSSLEPLIQEHSVRWFWPSRAQVRSQQHRLHRSLRSSSAVGPALRASALILYGNYLISKGQQSNVQNNIRPIVSNDLAYTGFGLWEEVNGTSFFTTAVQHKALVDSKTFAATLGHPCEAGLDINSVLTSIHTFDSAAACDDVTFQPCSARALPNHKQLVDSFRSIYGVNNGWSNGSAVAKPTDRTERTNTKEKRRYLATLAAAEQLDDALYQSNKQGALSVTVLSLPFFQDLVANVTTGTYAKASPTYRTITRAVKTYADDFCVGSARVHAR